MEFSVTRKCEGMVTPACEETQTRSSGMVLQLSVIDRLQVLRCNARTLHVYRRHGGGAAAAKGKAAQVIREALSKALIPYYPLAGRLHVGDDDDDELEIACSGEGIWFVEATADCTLDDVNCFEDNAMSIPYHMLLPPQPQQQQQQQQKQRHGFPLSDPLVQMQVTEFECGGLVIGLIFCHSVCDGLGAAQFLNAVGEFARGAHQPTITPQWCRNFLPFNSKATDTAPPPPPPPPPMVDIDDQLEHAAIDISADRIKELKHEFQEATGGMNCSTFELVAALLWRQRTRAILLTTTTNPSPQQQKDVNHDARLVFFANCRGLIRDPPLPSGFYGNCFFPVTVTVGCASLVHSSIVQVVKLIQQAKAGLPNLFAQWVASNYSLDPDPFAPPLQYNTLFISEWGRLGFTDVDFGWGSPVHVVPIQGSMVIPVGIVCSQPNNKPYNNNKSSNSACGRGVPVRLMTWCVRQPHLQPFLHQMTNSSTYS